VKSLTRRGKARRRLNKMKEALEDFNAVDKIEPNNKEILDDIRMLKNKINAIKEEQMKKMVLMAPMNNKKNSIKVQVMDYDPEKQANNLHKAPNKSDKREANQRPSQQTFSDQQKPPKEIKIDEIKVRSLSHSQLKTGQISSISKKLKEKSSTTIIVTRIQRITFLLQITENIWCILGWT